MSYGASFFNPWDLVGACREGGGPFIQMEELVWKVRLRFLELSHLVFDVDALDGMQ